MIVEAITFATVVNAIKISGTAVGVLGFLFGVFKVINWVKTKFISINDNVIELKNTMTENMSGLREDIKAQTTSITNELREQRQDFRTFYAPALLHTMQNNATIQSKLAPARAKRNVKKKS